MSHVFISYSHKDRLFVDGLIREFDRAGIRTWTDAHIQAGQQWKIEIDKAIETSFAVMVIVTPSARASEYVTYEWSYAIGRGKVVMPVLVHSDEMHPKLEEFHGFDFRHGQLPLDKVIPRLEMLKNAPSGTAAPVLSTLVPLLDDLQDPDENIRGAAAATLGNLKSAAAIPLLYPLLRDPSPDIRVTAIEALGEIGDDEATPKLISVIHNKSSDRTLRSFAYIALGRIASPKAVDFLVNDLVKARWLDQDGTAYPVAVAMPAHLRECSGSRWDEYVRILSTSCTYHVERIYVQFEEISRAIVEFDQQVTRKHDPTFLQAQTDRIEHLLGDIHHARQVLSIVSAHIGGAFDADTFREKVNAILGQLGKRGLT